MPESDRKRIVIESDLSVDDDDQLPVRGGGGSSESSQVTDIDDDEEYLLAAAAQADAGRRIGTFTFEYPSEFLDCEVEFSDSEVDHEFFANLDLAATKEEEAAGGVSPTKKKNTCLHSGQKLPELCFVKTIKDSKFASM
ncbi:OLC1v1007009C1 [Oldenlandia corymbosa var. corymbosa]|uniref:OLC1v1007009C1 n=1 Tax=Oldenlandia corymbosa var. corymbosa TaxID=529605 RepID=A0AAV1DIE8_OLDCO|nr:OLC1v1007009C1 [Oldenlandia corymbosa var. corymbosa]